MVIILGIVDYFSGYELSFSLFYIGPISLVAWYVNRKWAFLASVASAVTWGVADFIGGNPYSSPILYFWNSLVRLGFFLIVSYLIASQRRFIDREAAFGRTDFVTETPNARHFYDVVASELRRSSRNKRPLTVVYIDLDNFKMVNDRYGHAAGDHVLRTVASVLNKQLRASDLVARLGGDEFALLLPETSSESAQGIVARLHATLNAAMKDKDWPVTFSIGVITCLKSLLSVDDIVRLADDLMYTVKSKGKNGVTYSTYGG
ncbi:MAG: diguanylate cyclase [Thermodesulfobacteriota bacterium]